MNPAFYHRQWDAEVVIVQGQSRESLITEAEHLQSYLAKGPKIDLKDLAYTLNTTLRDRPWRLALVASSLHQLEANLAHALKHLAAPQTPQIKSKRGIYFFENPLSQQGKLAFLFPGEGSQYVNMLADLCIHFPEVRECFDRIDRVFVSRRGKNVPVPSLRIFPPSICQSRRKQTEAQDELWQMDGAVASVITANQAIFELLSHLDIRPQAVLGHSTGEYAAFQASGILDLDDESRYNRYMADLDEIFQRMSTKGGIPKVKLVAVGSDSDKVREIITQIDGELHVAMDNCPNQVVIVGVEAEVEKAIKELNRRGSIYQILPFDRPYHTSLFEPYAEDLRLFFERWLLRPPSVQVYSCTKGGLFSNDLDEIRRTATEHWVQPVRFRQAIEKMYEDGVRIFVEVGPRGNLTAFVNDILREKEHVAVAANTAARSGITQLNHMVGMLAAHGVPMRLGYLYARRAPVKITFDAEVARTLEKKDNPGSMTLNLEVPRLQLRQTSRSPKSLRPQLASDENKETPNSPARDLGGCASLPQAAEPQQELRLAPEGSTGSGNGHGSDEQFSARVPPSCSPRSHEDSRSAVLKEYLHTMEHFLEVQQEVMHRFLSGNDMGHLQGSIDTLSTAGRPACEAILQASESPKGDPCFAAEGKPARRPMPDPQASGKETRDSEHKLSTLDSSDDGSQSFTIGRTSTESIDVMLLAIVSEKTGYPEEMLGLNLDMEADLGIDSIKRIEILGTISERCGLKLEQDMEKVVALKTLQHVINFLREHLTKSVEKDAESHGFDDLPEHRTAEPTCSVEAEPSLYPMIGDVVSLVVGRKLEAVRRITLDQDKYLLDHTLGGKLSVVDDTLVALPVMPLTMSMEILAEAGAVLVPGKVLICIKDIRAYRWISIEEEHVDLRILAQASQDVPKEVYVRVYRLNEDEKSSDTVVIEGTAVFADAYPEPPSKGQFTLRGERPSRWRAEQLYTEAMFHGPSWQAVRSVDASGEDGSSATLEVRSTKGFLRSEALPRFVIDPIVLDAAGQVIGLWAMENLERGFLVFPYRVKALHVFRAQLPEHERVMCQARIKLVGTQQLSSDIDMVAEDGGHWMRLEAWEDKRFDLPSKSYAFLRSPIKMMASTTWGAPLVSFPNSNSLFCHRVDNFFHGDEPFWREVFGRLILNHKERETFHNLGKSEKRLNQWLLGRLVAKDAVRGFLKERYGLEVGPADVEIASDAYGRPVPAGFWAEHVEKMPSLSLAHTNGIAVSVAGHSNGNQQLGIDVERVRPLDKSFETAAFTSQELELLGAFGESEHGRWLIRFWCAKEALAKALGRGLVEQPLAVTVQGLDASEGTIKLSVTGELVQQFPDLAKKVFCVKTLEEDKYIVASTVIERNGHD